MEHKIVKWKAKDVFWLVNKCDKTIEKMKYRIGKWTAVLSSFLLDWRGKTKVFQKMNIFIHIL